MLFQCLITLQWILTETFILYKRNRLVKREKQFQWFGKVHEYLAISGEVFSSNVAITHKKKKSNRS